MAVGVVNYLGVVWRQRSVVVVVVVGDSKGVWQGLWVCGVHFPTGAMGIIYLLNIQIFVCPVS